MKIKLQKTAFSVVKSRLALEVDVGSWMFFFLVVTMPKIHRKMVVDCPLAITSIGKTLFQTRPERGKIGPATLLHSRHRVLLF